MPEAAASKMRAVFYRRFGPAREVLEFGEHTSPKPGHDEVLVKLAASGLNPHDTKKRSGWLGGTLPAESVIPHSDGAGVIIGVGGGVSESRVGERVFVYGAGYRRPGEGTAADYVAVPAHQAVRLPDGVSFTEGAALGVPAMTAYYAVLSDGPVTGLSVLVQGGAGAVGMVAIALARWNGARVIATVSSPEKAEAACAAGADAAVDYRREDVVARVRDLTNGAGVDRIVEVDFGANVAIDAACLKPNGTVASYSSTRVRAPILPYYDFARMGARLLMLQAGNMPERIQQDGVKTIVALLDRGLLRPRIAAVYPLEEVAAAHDSLETGDVIGNIVIAIGEKNLERA